MHVIDRKQQPGLSLVVRLCLPVKGQQFQPHGRMGKPLARVLQRQQGHERGRVKGPTNGCSRVERLHGAIFSYVFESHATLAMWPDVDSYLGVEVGNACCSCYTVGTDDVTSALLMRRKRWTNGGMYVAYSPEGHRREAFVILVRCVEVANRRLYIYNVFRRGEKLVGARVGVALL